MCYNVANSRTPFLIVSAPVMPRRSVVLLTPPHYTPDSAVRTLLHSPYTSFAYKNKAHPLSPQPLPHSYTKTPGCQGLYLQTLSRKMCHQYRFFRSADFGLFTDHGTRSTDHAPLTPLSATLTKNQGEGTHPHSSTRREPGEQATARAPNTSPSTHGAGFPQPAGWTRHTRGATLSVPLDRGRVPFGTGGLLEAWHG